MSRENELAILLHQGMSYTKAAKQMGISRQRVHQIAKASDLEKVWQEKDASGLYKRKHNFSLGPSLYSICNKRFHRKRQNCKNQKIPFLISFEEIEWPTHCPILGIPIDYESIENTRVENSPSFDKTNPKLGYVSGNVKIVSWRANRIKNDGTAEEHRKIANYLDMCDLQNVE